MLFKTLLAVLPHHGLQAGRGAKVALVEIHPDSGSAAEREIRESGGEAIFVQADVTQDEDIKLAVAQTIARFGRLDVLLNCAGGSIPQDVRVHEMDLAVWHRTIALNLLHPFLTCRHGIPHMISGGGGSIINISSHVGLMGSIRPAYAAAKGGLGSFTKTLAAQYAEYGIRANALAPGSVLTPRTSAHFRNKEWQKKLYPFSFGEPADIASIAVFLASDESRMITGTTIAADGGRSSYLKISESAG